MGLAYVAYYDLRSALKAFTGINNLKFVYGSIRVEYVQAEEFGIVSFMCKLGHCFQAKPH